VIQRRRGHGSGITFLDAAALPVTSDGILNGAVDAPGPATSFLADRASERWYDGEPVRSGDSVSGKIGQFQPRNIPPDAWDRIEGAVRGAVEKAAPQTSNRAVAWLNAVTQLANWADTVGQSLAPENLFHPETIDRFVREGVGHLSLGTQTNYRSQLRRVAKAVIGSTLYPPTGIVPRPDPRLPYTQAEVGALVSWASGQPTEHTRRNAMALVSLGLGTGLASQEITRLTGDDVVADQAGVVVRVVGQRSREVPVLRRWEDHVANIARESGSRPFLLPGRSQILKHAISNFVDRCSRAGAPELSVQRLRTTWIVNQMEAGTPLPVLSAVAGVAPTQLARYFALMREPDLDVVRQRIRDAVP
jgi:integrase